MPNVRDELIDRLATAIFSLKLRGKHLTAVQVIRRWGRWRRGELVKIRWSQN